MPQSPLHSEDLREIGALFLLETREAFEALEVDLLRLETTPSDTSLLDRIFRTVHTVKGTSLFLGLEQLGALAHQAEDLLNHLRYRSLNLQPAEVNALLRAFEVMKILLQQVADENVVPLDLEELFSELRKLSGGTLPPASPNSNNKKDRITSINVHAALKEVERDRLVEFAADTPPTGDAASGQELTGIAARIGDPTERLQVSLAHTGVVRIGQVFDRFHRLVRDLSLASGKHIQLVTEGDDIGLDRHLVKDVSGALIQLIQNAVDHGIETPRVRAARGKSATGCIRVSAARSANQVILVIEDDGAGLEPETLRHAAVSRMLVTKTEAASMRDTDLHALIFRPGFSTAFHVSRTSGRGVGMDVVRTTVDRLGGTISIDSVPGSGTRFVIRIPR